MRRQRLEQRDPHRAPSTPRRLRATRQYDPTPDPTLRLDPEHGCDPARGQRAHPPIGSVERRRHGLRHDLILDQPQIADHRARVGSKVTVES